MSIRENDAFEEVKRWKYNLIFNKPLAEKLITRSCESAAKTALSDRFTYARVEAQLRAGSAVPEDFLAEPYRESLNRKAA